MEREWFLPKLIAEYRKLEDEHFAGQHFLTTKIVPCRFLSSPNLLGAALKADMIHL